MHKVSEKQKQMLSQDSASLSFICPFVSSGAQRVIKSRVIFHGLKQLFLVVVIQNIGYIYILTDNNYSSEDNTELGRRLAMSRSGCGLNG